MTVVITVVVATGGEAATATVVAATEGTAEVNYLRTLTN
jgi:hypothetical protein